MHRMLPDTTTTALTSGSHTSRLQRRSDATARRWRKEGLGFSLCSGRSQGHGYGADIPQSDACQLCAIGYTPSTLHPTPYALDPSPYALHLHPTPYALHPTPYTLRSAPYALHPPPYALHPTPYAQCPTPCILHPTPCTLHPTPVWSSTPNSTDS
eukprot:327092-Rhodomonas_salina.3